MANSSLKFCASLLCSSQQPPATKLAGVADRNDFQEQRMFQCSYSAQTLT
jgi:hypothetical protein